MNEEQEKSTTQIAVYIQFANNNNQFGVIQPVAANYCWLDYRLARDLRRKNKQKKKWYVYQTQVQQPYLILSPPRLHILEREDNFNHNNPKAVATKTGKAKKIYQTAI